MPHIVLPAPLRDYTEGVSPVAVEGTTISDALADLVDRFPRLRRHLFDDGGRLRGFVNVYVNDRDARTLDDGLATAVPEDAVLLIVPSVAGGGRR